MDNLITNTKAISKYVKISPSKVNLVISKIRGKTYKQALKILKALPQKAAYLVWQTLYSAASNASNNFSISKKELIIKAAYANKASILKRMQPRARGKAYRIEKRFSHVTIELMKLPSLKL